jgi:hypothetical protein
MSSDLFPIRDQGKTLKFNKIYILARCTNTGTYSVVMTPPSTPPLNTMKLNPSDQYGGLHFHINDDVAAQGIELVLTDPPVKWQLKMTRSGSKLKDEVEDLFLVLGYEWE